MTGRFFTIPLKLIPDQTKIDFVGKRYFAYGFTFLLFLISFTSLGFKGLNMGIDFKGGILIEAKALNEFSLATMRADLEKMDLGEIALQAAGTDGEIMINVQQQDSIAATNKATQDITNYLGQKFEIRRTELVGPKVGDELFKSGLIATGLAILAIAIYVAFRFEWQFGISALLGTFHDVFVTIGLFSFLGLEFNLSSVAAILTIAGYSINDTVIVFDRIRENLTKYKRPKFEDIFNMSINQTLSRTILTSSTTLLAILPLLLFGGPNLFDFTLALTWGIFIGTFSSIFVSAPLLMFMRPIRPKKEEN